jgi:hypothetical protein
MEINKMSKYIVVFTDPTNTPCPTRYFYEFDTPEQAQAALEQAQSRPWDYPVIENPRIITYDDIPKDRVFRNAWTDEHPTPTVDVDIEKAKNIHMDRIRVIRNKELEATDKEFIKALSKGEDTTELTAKKQKLRDIPQDIEPTVSNCATVEELLATWPEDLELHPIYKNEE